MMPIIQPLPTQCDPPTEYKKEREVFAKMQADLHWRNRLARRLIRLLRDVRGRAQRGRRFRPVATPDAQSKCAQGVAV